ncbi:hypothetical protein GIB67_041863 [Kingdonia uniflora]|uniref:Protein TIFY n=1 Tax=Kingdonia uniflora TaxID=39325 RepID=A0A7J7L5Y5_9MAGN|nr:hypothetical protein GIB67_041863 [Kingdonia uniflora]
MSGEGATTIVEHDFFGLEKENINAAKSKFQRTVSKINPLLLKSVIGGNPLPVFNHSISPPATPVTPLTIFYNGTVSVFDVAPSKAEFIIKFAEKGSSETAVESQSDEQKLFEKLRGDLALPIMRNKSLQRFLEKRKERLTSASPYASGSSTVVRRGTRCD